MEIERKWMVNGWPEGLPLKEEFAMRQGYISVRPTVRIREEALTGGETRYVLCFKSGGGLAREEIERDIDPELFNDLETKIIGRPLIPKLRRSYLLPDGAVLEVNHVDEGQPTEFWYAEVEYPTVEAARSWQPAAVGLADYLSDEVTDQPARAWGLLGADPGLRPNRQGRKNQKLGGVTAKMTRTILSPVLNQRWPVPAGIRTASPACSSKGSPLREMVTSPSST